MYKLIGVMFNTYYMTNILNAFQNGSVVLKGEHVDLGIGEAGF